MLEKATVTEYSFTTSETTSLDENPQIAQYRSKLKSINIDNLKIDFTHLQAGEEIKTISFSVSSVGVIATLNNITSSNAKHTPSIESAKLKQVADQLNNSKQITITLKGTSNKAPMNFITNMDFDLKIKAGVL